MTEGFLPNVIVVRKVPLESCLITAGEREPRGLDFGEFCSGGRLPKSAILRHFSFPTGGAAHQTCSVVDDHQRERNE